MTEIKKTLEMYFKMLHTKQLKEQLDILHQAINNITGSNFNVIDAVKPTTDRDILECIQESYSLIYCLIYNLEYTNFRVTPKILKEDRYFNWIADYKVEHFASEIFEDLGMEVVEKRKDGFVVKDRIPPTKLN